MLKLLFLFLNAVNLWAGMFTVDDPYQCKPFRLDKNGGPFESYPFFDQKINGDQDQSICYAITAAQIIDSARFYQNKDSLQKVSSPLDLAINYKLKNLNNHTSGDAGMSITAVMAGTGNIYQAIKIAENLTYCDQNFLEKYAPIIDNGNHTSSYPSSSNDFIKAVFADAKIGTKSYFKYRIKSDADSKLIQEAYHKANSEIEPRVMLSSFLKVLCKSNSISLGELNVKVFRGITARDSHKADFKDMLVQNHRSYDDELDEHERQDAKNKEWKYYKNNKKVFDRFFVKTQQIFNDPNPVPVAISFDPSVYSNGKVSGDHAAVIIGQRKSLTNNECEYLVRDSYGANCKADWMGFLFSCDNGGHWIPAQTLMKKTRQLIWIPR